MIAEYGPQTEYIAEELNHLLYVAEENGSTTSVNIHAVVTTLARRYGLEQLRTIVELMTDEELQDL